MENSSNGPLLNSLQTGGQTGVDRAVLDVALSTGLQITGWCPRGRKSEDGTLAKQYPLKETPSAKYDQRTSWNIRDSDGTLILLKGKADGGTILTMEKAHQKSKPLLVVDLENPLNFGIIRHWLWQSKIRHLNVAGPRESRCPGIYQATRMFLARLFAELFENF